MSWTDFFRSRYVRSLESELASIRQKHAKETAETGTPFQRMAKRIMEEDEKQYRIREAERKAKEEANKFPTAAQPQAAQEKN